MLTIAAAFVATPVLAQPAQVVTWKAKVAHVKDDVYRVTFEANIPSGWHIYDLGPYDNGIIPTAFEFEKNANLELVGKVKEVKPTVRHFDETWGMDVGYIEGKPSFTQDVKLKGDKAKLTGLIIWQSCNDESCLPPGEHEFSLEIVKVKPVADATQAQEPPVTTAAADAAAAASADETVEAATTDETAEETPVTVTDTTDEGAVITADEGGAEEEKGFWGNILQAIIWGFVSLLTPCVFPMVPVTVSFFMKGSENKAKAKFRAISFGLFIIILYTLPILILTIVSEIFGGAGGAVGMFNWLGTHWIPNSIFFIVFMIFAASFFGAFEITLPSSMINKSDSKADKGGLIGVFFMALTLVLISFSCTAPIVGTVIVDSATTSTVWWQPIIIMLVYSFVFAIPFTLLAFIPSLMTKLKSGGWMNSVKVSIAFVEVALGFKFLMVIDQNYSLNILSRELYLAIWIACGIMWGLYLLGVYKTKHDSEVQSIGPVRIAFALMVFIFTIWMFPGLWGAPLKPLSGYMPPMNAQNYTVASVDDLRNMSFVSSAGNAGGQSDVFDGKINPLTGKAPKYSEIEGMHTPRGFVAFYDFDEACEYAKHVNKPVFIDFTGVSCVNCRAMEQNVWTDPGVAKILREDYVMVCIFMDIRIELPEKDWVTTNDGKVLKRLNNVNMDWAYRNFQTVAQPEYVVWDPRDNKQLAPKRAYNTNIDAYREWLETGLEVYKGK